MSDNFKYVQAQPFSLSGAGAVIGDTSITLKTFQGIDGANLTMTNFGSVGFGTLEPGNGTLEEQISFTGVTQNANGTATLTGIKSVDFVSPYTTTSGLLKTHAGSTSFVISNTSGFYDSMTSKNDDETITGTYTFTNPKYPEMDTATPGPTGDNQLATKKYVDDVATYGAPFATDTTYGISKLSVAAANPVQPISVGTNDGRVPSQGENDALVGTSGTPASTNKYVTNDDTSTTASASSVVRRIASGATTVPTTPVNTTDAASKSYVDTQRDADRWISSSTSATTAIPAGANWAQVSASGSNGGNNTTLYLAVNSHTTVRSVVAVGSGTALQYGFTATWNVGGNLVITPAGSANAVGNILIDFYK